MITQRRVRSPQHPAGRRRGAPGGCRAGPRAAGWPPAVVSGTSVIENGVAVPPRTGVPIIVHSSPWTFTPLPMVSATREWKTRSPYVGLSRKSWRTEVQINILGPLEAIVGGESIVPSATKPRKVLALLIANANHVVPISKLKFEIWDDNPPISASTTLQTYVLQLRKLIGNAVWGCPTEAKDILVTRPNGYMGRAGPARRGALRAARAAGQREPVPRRHRDRGAAAARGPVAVAGQRAGRRRAGPAVAGARDPAQGVPAAHPGAADRGGAAPGQPPGAAVRARGAGRGGAVQRDLPPAARAAHRGDRPGTLAPDVPPAAGHAHRRPGAGRGPPAAGAQLCRGLTGVDLRPMPGPRSGHRPQVCGTALNQDRSAVR